MSRGAERRGLSEDDHHRERAQRKKELVDRRIARATIDRGVVVVNTGSRTNKGWCPMLSKQPEMSASSNHALAPE